MDFRRKRGLFWIIAIICVSIVAVLGVKFFFDQRLPQSVAQQWERRLDEGNFRFRIVRYCEDIQGDHYYVFEEMGFIEGYSVYYDKDGKEMGSYSPGGDTPPFRERKSGSIPQIDQETCKTLRDSQGK